MMRYFGYTLEGSQYWIGGDEVDAEKDGCGLWISVLNTENGWWMENEDQEFRARLKRRELAQPRATGR